MGLSGFDRFRIRLMEFCANSVELLYYPLLYKKYDGLEKKENVREGERALRRLRTPRRYRRLP